MKIYLCHTWVNSPAYQAFVALLEGLVLDGMTVEIVSQPSHELTMALGSPEGQKALIDLMKTQMQDADVILLPLYVLNLRRQWATIQIKLARRELKKQIIGLAGAPNDPLHVPYEARYICDRIIEAASDDLSRALSEIASGAEAG